MQQIVLGYDASPAAERALARTIELASALDAPVAVASIAPVHETAMRGTGTRLDPADPPGLHASMARAAVAKLAEHGVEAEPVLGLGHTAETLVDLADAREADLIVVGMSSRGLLGRVFRGVSDDVAHEAKCDVLLVH